MRNVLFYFNLEPQRDRFGRSTNVAKTRGELVNAHLVVTFFQLDIALLCFNFK